MTATRRRVLRALIVFALVLAAFGLLWSTNWLSTLAYAQQSVCQAELNDNGNLLRGDERTAIVEKVREVEALGADIHVWTFGELPNPDAATGDAVKDELTVWFNQQVAACAEWHRPNSTEPRSNLVVLAYSNNPVRSIMVIGEQWPLSQERADASRRTMSPAFKDGAFGRGFLTGLDTVRAIIGPGQGQQPETPAQPSAPIDWSWLWYVLYAIIGLIVIIGIVVLIRRMVRTARHRREMQEKATTGTATLRTNFLTLEGLRAELEGLVVGLYEYSEEDLRPIRELMAEFMRHYEEVVLELGEIDGTVDDRDEVLASRAESIILDAEQGNVAVERARDAEARLRQAVEALVALPTSLPARITATEEAIATARTRVTVITDQGFLTTSQGELLTTADTELASARKAHGERRFNAAAELLDQADSHAETAATEAEQLPETKKALEGRVTRINDDRKPTLARQITAAQAILVSIQKRFAAVHSEDLLENCTIAQTLLDGVDAILERAATALQDQNWTEADQILAEAESQIAKAFTQLQAIKSRNTELTQLSRSLPQRATEALAAIRRVRTFIDAHRDDITSDCTDLLDTARRHIEEAQAALALSPLNLNTVADLLGSADEEISEARSTVAEEHRAAEARRQHARQKREEAERLLRGVRSYISSNRSRVNSGTVQRLSTLEGRHTDDLSDAAFWVAVISAAQDLRSQAEADVDANTPDPPSSGSGSSGTISSGGLGFGGPTTSSGDLGGGPTISSGEL